MSVRTWKLGGEKEREPLRYPDCGLDDVYLVSGYEKVKTPYGDGISVKNLDGLHKAIGCYLAKEKKVLNGKELRFLRKQMDLTQSELGALVGLSYQQVARWEKEVCPIPPAAETILRVLFIEDVGGAIKVRALLGSLEERDAPLNESTVFAKTPRGWEKQKAA